MTPDSSHANRSAPGTPNTRRSWATRPLTPLDVAFERSKTTAAKNRLRVPQPGGGMTSSSSHGDLPSATVLTNYATIQSHLNAARSLANF